MNEIAEVTSQKIKNMSFVCSVLIVCLHAQDPTDWGRSFYLQWFSDGGITDMCVPFFFIVSGFFFVNHLAEDQWWTNAVKRRFFTLLVPYLLLNLLYFPIKYACHYVGYRYFGADHSNPIMEVTFKNFLICISPIPIGNGPVIGPLWYVRSLIWLVLFSPLYIWLLRKSRQIAFVFVFIVGILWLLQNTEGRRFHLNGAYEYELRCLFYFAIGILLRLWGGFVTTKLLGYLCVALGLALHVIQSYSLTFDFIISNASIILLIAGMWTLMPASKWSPLLTKNSFVIYALHGPLIYLWGAIYKAFHLASVATSTIGVVVSIVIYVGMSCMVGNIVRYKYPMVAKYLFGGR